MIKRIRDFWENRGAREKLYVLGGSGALLVALLAQFAILPFWEDRQRVGKAVESQEKILREINGQAAEYLVLKRDVDAIQGVLSSRPPNFTLYSFVERKAREAGMRANVKTINPSKGMPMGAFEEAIADVGLEKLTLRQLVQFLYLAESPRDAVRVRKLSVRKSAESPEYLTVTVQLATYQAAAPRPAPSAVMPRKGG